MEDDQAPANVPDSLLPYDQWMETALRQVVVRALQHAAVEGLPGEHHFYITFRTDFPGVSVPKRIAEKYPHEMTVVLQHQFHGLTVDEAAGTVAVTLSFGGVSSPLLIPLEAISAFVDPHVQYGLRFRVNAPEAPPEEVAPPAEPGEPQQVVSLAAFRKKKE